MNCKYDSQRMLPIGLSFANGWRCPACDHEEVEIASYKLAGELPVLWQCTCYNCEGQ